MHKADILKAQLHRAQLHRAHILKTQRGGFVAGFLKFLFMMIVLVAIAGGAGFYFANEEFHRAGPSSEDHIVMIKPGMGTGQIAALLEEQGIIRSALFLRAIVRVHDIGGSLQAGEYLIPAGASLDDVLHLLREGKSILHKVTVPEGRTTKQVLAIIANDEVLTGEITLTPAEGDLLPETYAFTRGETRDEMIARMMKDHNEVLDSLWGTRVEGLPLKTKEEAVVLASIVEKETGVASERPQVAAVFINRLNKGIRLQSDPTIIYGLTGGEPLGRGIRQSELERATPYNTYVIRGLPPTPIANPGKESIAAVLNPADTKDLYFVADGTGGHVFAETLAEHNRNVAKWRKIEAERANQ